MATKGMLAELAGRHGGVALEAVGGVDAARRVRAGEAVDVVVLAARMMAAMEAEGVIVAGSVRGMALSAACIAVREGEAAPSLADEAAVRAAVLGARRIGYSTGPSGEHFLALLARWGVRDTLEGRLVRARPGEPAGGLLAAGEVDLALQQRSELMEVPGIVVVGSLPKEIGLETVFSAGVAVASLRQQEARALIAFLASAEATEAARRHGLEPAPTR